MSGSKRRSIDVIRPPHGGEGLIGFPDAVAFAHGSGSSRFSPGNALVAAALQEAGFATLRSDRLTAQDAVSPSKVFDISLLAGQGEAD